MISQIRLENYKCFKQLSLELSNLNVLAGINSMGKSSIIQVLLLLRQSFSNNALKKGLHLNGSYIQLGTGYDVMNRMKQTHPYSVSLFYQIFLTHEDVQEIQMYLVLPLFL